MKNKRYERDALRKHEQRRELINNYEMHALPLPYMERFAEKLEPCPVCGGRPKLCVVRYWEDETATYKFVCRTFHPGEPDMHVGGWFDTLAAAGRSWNNRTRGRPDDGLDMRLYRLLRG